MATTIGNEMFVDMKMNITTCGAHSGLIVHSGIVQHQRDNAASNSSANNPSFTWPYMNANQQFVNAPWSSSINDYSQLQQYNRQQHPSCEQPYSQSPYLSPQSSSQQQQQQNGQNDAISLVQTFDGNDSPPSEFIQPDNVQLNLFQLNAQDYTEPHLNRNERKYKRTAEQRSEVSFNDVKIRSGTLEALRADVDSNALKESNRLQVHYTVEPNYEERIIGRKEPLMSAQRSKWWSKNASERPRLDSITRPQNYLENESFTKSNYYHAAELANNIPPLTINNRHMSVNDLTYIQQQQALSDNPYQQSSFYPNPYNQHNTNIEPEIENLYEISRSRSVEDMDRLRTTYDDCYRQHPLRPRNNVHFREAPRPTRTTQTIRAEIGRNDELRSATTVPEEMFHLYETRDAFGNIRAQCVSNIKVSEHGQSTSTSFERLINDDSNNSPTPRTASNFNYLYSSCIEIPQHGQAQQFIAYNQRENDHIPYYSTKNASTSNIFPTEFENPYELFPDDLQKVSPSSKHLTQSPLQARSPSPNTHSKRSPLNTVDENDLNTGTLQSSLFDADEDQRSLLRFAQVLTNPNAVSSNDLQKEKYTTADRSAWLRSPALGLSNADTEALIGEKRLDSKNERRLRKVSAASAINEVGDILQQRAPSIVNEARNDISTVHQHNANTVHRSRFMPTEDFSSSKNSRLTASNDDYGAESLMRNGIKHNDEFIERNVASLASLKSKVDNNATGDDYTVTEELMQKSSVAHHSIPLDIFSYENTPQMIHHCADQHSPTVQDISPSCSYSYSLKHYPVSTNSKSLTENAAFGTVLAKSQNDDVLIDQNECENLNPGLKRSAKNNTNCSHTTNRNIMHWSSPHDNNTATELVQANSTDGSDVAISLNDHSITPLLSETTTKQFDEKSSMQISDIKLLNNDGGTVTDKTSTASSSVDECFKNDTDTNQQTTVDSNKNDAIAAPSKSILHLHSKKSVRHSKRNKSVSFPFQPQPTVIVNEHRLFITNIDDSDSSDNCSKNQ